MDTKGNDPLDPFTVVKFYQFICGKKFGFFKQKISSFELLNFISYGMINCGPEQ